MSMRLWKIGHDCGFDPNSDLLCIISILASPGALAFVLGVNLAAGFQGQYSETTGFNLSHVMLTC